MIELGDDETETADCIRAWKSPPDCESVPNAAEPSRKPTNVLCTSFTFHFWFSIFFSNFPLIFPLNFPLYSLSFQLGHLAAVRAFLIVELVSRIKEEISASHSSLLPLIAFFIAVATSILVFSCAVLKKMNRNLEIMDELCGFTSEKPALFDLGHPLANRVAECFVKAAGIGAVQAVSREAYFSAVEGTGGGSNLTADVAGGSKTRRFPDLRGESNRKSLEAMVKHTGKESLQWGLAAGVYSGLTYGLKEARGTHDWKNSAVAGALTGMALALTAEDSSHEHVVQCAITGAAISTAANLLTGIF